jgi:NAD(P)-dependent dehydrogenase (short-subunit alcohol dehydrogenase family)
MDLHLGGKVAAVTCAGKGLGWAITRALVEMQFFYAAPSTAG